MQDNNNIANEILQDINKRKNKKNDWRGKKLQTITLSDSYLRLKKYSKSERTRACGTDLEFKLTPNEMKLHRANFCKIRLCPMCTWRRSLKIFGQVSKIMDVLEEDDHDFIFLTLTIKNVSADDLNNALDRLSYAFKKLTLQKKFKKNILGFFRATEVTYNAEADTFHPHLHCILVVSKTYFHGGYYIPQYKWVNMWHNALAVDYMPSVDVRKINKGKNTKKAVAEVSKYTVKMTEYITDNNSKTDYLVDTYDTALARRRLVAFGGLMKDIHKKLKLDDIEDGDLTMTDNTEDEMRQDVQQCILHYKWGIGAFGYNYYLTEKE